MIRGRGLEPKIWKALNDWEVEEVQNFLRLLNSRRVV